MDRLDLPSVCDSYLAPGLGLEDFLITENAVVIAVIALLTYLPKVFDEPPIMEYTASSGECTREKPLAG
jgi:hypothetical protein